MTGAIDRIVRGILLNKGLVPAGFVVDRRQAVMPNGFHMLVMPRIELDCPNPLTFHVLFCLRCLSFVVEFFPKGIVRMHIPLFLKHRFPHSCQVLLLFLFFSHRRHGSAL